MAERARCVECAEELSDERVELGYRYCTRAACQAVRHRGLRITTVGVNKSADNIVVADADEVRRRGEAGEFGKKDTALGLDYRRGTTPGRSRGVPRPPARTRSRTAPGGRPSRRRSSGSTTTWAWLRGRSPSEPGRTRLGWASPSGSPFRSCRPRRGTDAAPDARTRFPAPAGTRSSRSPARSHPPGGRCPRPARSPTAQGARFGEGSMTPAPTVEICSSPPSTVITPSSTKVVSPVMVTWVS